MTGKRQRLIDERKKLKKTQEDIAKEFKITTSYYGMIEVGSRNPSLSLAKKMEDFFKIPIKELFFANTDNKPLLNDSPKIKSA